MNRESTFEERQERGKIAAEFAREYYGTPKYRNKNLYVINSGIEKGDNKCPVEFFENIPPLVKNIPDFVVTGEHGARFVEVKSGWDHIKFKKIDLISYEHWNKIMPVDFICYAEKVDCLYKITLKGLKRLIEEQNFDVKKYPNNGKEYHYVPTKELNLVGEDPIDRRK